MPQIKLPDNVTPEQFAKAEPLLLTLILHDPENPDSGYGNPIVPLTEQDFQTKRVRAVKPGEYVGEFRDKEDPRRRFSFKLTAGDPPMLYISPINPEIFKEENANPK